MAKRRETFCKGASIEDRTMTSKTSAADGMGATDNEAAKEVKITVIISPTLNCIELI